MATDLRKLTNQSGPRRKSGLSWVRFSGRVQMLSLMGLFVGLGTIAVAFSHAATAPAPTPAPTVTVSPTPLPQ